MPRTVGAQVAAALHELDSSNATYCFLVEVQMADNHVFRITNAEQALTFGGNPYAAVPFKVGEFGENDTGEPQGLEITVSNVTGEVSRRLMNYRGFDRWNVVLTAAVLDPDTGTIIEAVFSERFRVSEIPTSEDSATFVLGEEDLNAFKMPHRRFHPRFCQHPYKGTRCGYTGPLETCDRTLRGENGCEAHDNVARFGAQPAMPPA